MPSWTRTTLRSGWVRLLSKNSAAPEAEALTETFAADVPQTPDLVATAWGPFENLELLGQGAFGTVYKAFDPGLRRDVALKLLRRGGPQTELFQEARTLARLRHPNIVPVYGVEAHSGQVGFWCELIRGRTLASIVRNDGPMSARETALIGMDLCGALSAVHSAGVLHRDIKAENVMREEGGRLLLMDFGLSHDAGAQSGEAGTPLYMAPELFQGKRASPSTDLYALGVMLYFLVSGRFPYPARTLNELREAHARDRRLRLADARPDLPAALTRVIERACHPEAAKRYASAGQLQADLAEFVAGWGARRSRRRLALAAVVLLTVAGGLAYRTVSRWGTASPAAHELYLEGQQLMARYDQPGNLDRALQLFEKTVQTDPQFALGHAAIAQAHWLRFVGTRDAKFLDAALVNANRAMELNREISSIYVVQGEIHNWTGKRDLAAQELKRALELDSRNAAAVRALASSYFNQNRTKEAAEHYRRAIDLDPDNWENYFAYGNFLTRTGNLKDALARFEDALQRSPNNPLVLTNLGNIYLRLEDLPRAREMYERSVKVEPRYRALANLGTVLTLEGKYSEARGAFQQALEMNPSDYALWGALASAHRWEGDAAGKAKELFEKAAEMAEAARKGDPSNAKLLALLGGWYAAAGKSQKSLPFLRQALALAPDDGDTSIHAGEGLEQLGLRDEAIRAINHGLERGFPKLYVERNPDLASLRGDPRYGKQIHTVNQ